MNSYEINSKLNKTIIVTALVAAFAALLFGIQTVSADTNPPCECTNPVTETMFSDLTTTVVGDSPAAVAVHPAWTASIPGSTWIWKSGATASNEVVAFEKNFTVSGTVLSAQLDIATDNSYQVFIDNVLVAQDANANNFQVGTQDIHDLTLQVTPGNHTLRIEVKNVGAYSVGSNPAGLLYKFEVRTCPDKCCGGDVEVEIENSVVIRNDVNTTADTGNNTSNGGSAKSKSKARRGGDATSEANGGNGGTVITSNADAYSGVSNKVNTNIVRIRR